MGMPFNRTPEGRIDQRRFGGHPRPRQGAGAPGLLRRGPHRPHDPADALPELRQARRRVLQRVPYALDLVLTETPRGPATGVVAYELATGDIHVFHAKAIVLATGGSGRMYKTTSNAHTLTGDGLGIVFRKGLPLEDMEFTSSIRPGWPGSASRSPRRFAARVAGCSTARASGSRNACAPTIVDPPLRDIVARSMVLEVLEGRGAGPRKDYVYIDVRHRRGRPGGETADITEFSRTYLGVDPVGTGAGIPHVPLRDGRNPDDTHR